MDFEQHMVIALLWGEIPMRCGERIEVHHLWNATAAEMHTNLSDVAVGVEGEWYDAREHPAYEAGYHDVSQACTSATTQLYTFLRAPRIDGPVGFQMEDRTHFVWFAPLWDTGESWNYTITRDDRVEGWARWTIVGARDGSYEMEQVALRENATERTTFVWPDEVIRFPLEQGKTWNDEDGWHTAWVRGEATVAGRPFEGVWLVHGGRADREGNATQIDVYDHDERGLALRAWFRSGPWGMEALEVWDLREHLRS